MKSKEEVYLELCLHGWIDEKDLHHISDYEIALRFIEKNYKSITHDAALRINRDALSARSKIIQKIEIYKRNLDLLEIIDLNSTFVVLDEVELPEWVKEARGFSSEHSLPFLENLSGGISVRPQERLKRNFELSYDSLKTMGGGFYSSQNLRSVSFPVLEKIGRVHVTQGRIRNFSAPNLKQIDDFFTIYADNVYMPQLEIVLGNLSFQDLSNFEMPNLKRVGGNLEISPRKIQKLDKLEEVVGDIIVCSGDERKARDIFMAAGKTHLAEKVTGWKR